MKPQQPIFRGSEYDPSKERIHMPSPGFSPDRTVVARPIIEAEASWWEDGTRVEITVRREAMMGVETLEDSMRHVQQIIDILLNG